MVTIAIAGGTGNIGKTIAEVLKNSLKHNVIVLTRKERPAHQRDPKVPEYVVDYNDVDSLEGILVRNMVSVVISTIQVMGPESGAAEISLVRAASRAIHTHRFVSSDWGIPFPEPSQQNSQHQARSATMAELRKTNLEWTTFHIGMVADYFGLPHIQSYMTPISIHVDMASKKAVIPGTGNDLVSFTYSFDIARFVEAALDAPYWEEETFCYGDVCTFNDVIKMAEEARGSKFSVVYDDAEKLKRGEATDMPDSDTLLYAYFPQPILQATRAQFGAYVLDGLWHLPEDRSLNKRFPEIRTRTVKEVMDAWKGL